MNTGIRHKGLLLKGAFAALALAAGLLFSPRLVKEAHATLGGCSVTCASGSTCSSPSPGEGERCTCTCSLWTGRAQCSCTKLREDVEG